MTQTREHVASSAVREAIDRAAALWHDENPDEPRGMEYATSGNVFLYLAEQAYHRMQPAERRRGPSLYPDLDYRHVVYVARDADEEPLYVGVTSNFTQRMNAHRHNSGWWSFAASVRCTGFPTRRQANIAEHFVIQGLAPPWNRHNKVRTF